MMLGRQVGTYLQVAKVQNNYNYDEKHIKSGHRHVLKQ